MNELLNGPRSLVSALLVGLLWLNPGGPLLAAPQVPQIPQIPAFLPMAHSVPRGEVLDIDGLWRISANGKRVQIEAGRAVVVDPWLHLFVLKVERDMVVIRNITPNASGGYSGEDLPLMGPWTATRLPNGVLDVQVAGALGPVRYQMTPIALDQPGTGRPPATDDGPPDHSDPEADEADEEYFDEDECGADAEC